MTLWELDCCVWKGRVWETTGMQAFQASGRKGKPNWVSFFTLWFSFRVTTDEVQTLLFTALLNAFNFGFLSWLEPCFSWGAHIFQLFYIVPLFAWLSPSFAVEIPQGDCSFWQSTSLAAGCLFWDFYLFYLKPYWDLRLVEKPNCFVMILWPAPVLCGSPWPFNQ